MAAKILITGSAGGLGCALYPVLVKHGYDIIATGFRRLGENDFPVQLLDISDYYQVSKMFKEVRPDWVMHLAAETDVDLCEKEPDHAYKINTLGTENIAMACKEIGAGMVYVSTSMVFDGKQVRPYTEFDHTGPVNVYGRAKLEGEKIVQRMLDRYFIFRSGWLLGGGKKDKKFVAKIVRQVQTEKEIKAVNDKFGSPTFTHDMSEHIVKIFQMERYGLYHLCNKGHASRFEIAKKIVEILKRKDVTVIPVSSEYFPLAAPRAAAEIIRNYRLDLLGLNTMPHWQESLEKYLLDENTQF